jgi:hypothetical protein
MVKKGEPLIGRKGGGLVFKKVWEERKVLMK